jgi:CheY-like chemotaxis protein
VPDKAKTTIVHPGELLTLEAAANKCDVDPSVIEGLITAGQLATWHSPDNTDEVVRVFDLLGAFHAVGRELPPGLAEYRTRVLITEDDKEMARAIERVIRNAGYCAQIAPDGFQASSIVESYCPTLIILDLNMPHMHGLEVLQYLRSDPKYSHIRTLVLSAAGQAALDEALSLGADAAFEKPFENEQLLEAVKRLLA